jgi:stearoyl-CoA desaturase (delta-9 desaturase)
VRHALSASLPTQQWVAVHRCHHAHVDAEGDPHSPIFYGIWRVVLLGTRLYHDAATDPEVIAQYGKGTPMDLLELGLYSPYSLIGPIITLVMNVWLFGVWGIGMWLLEMAWIPFFAAGVINGLGHWWGYRNFETPDASRNLPGRIWSILTCGEALHNNHHHVQNSPNFSVKRGEIDLGHFYYKVLAAINLAKLQRETVQT